MTQLLYDPVDLSNYAKRGDTPIEEWPGIPVGRERIMASAGEGSYRDNLFVERLWPECQVRGGLSEGIRRRQGCQGRYRRVSQFLQHPETSPGLGLSNPGGGIHIWKWRKRGNITDDINTGVYKGSPRS